jgi:hypothetical protein
MKNVQTKQLKTTANKGANVKIKNKKIEIKTGKKPSLYRKDENAIVIDTTEINFSKLDVQILLDGLTKIIADKNILQYRKERAQEILNLLSVSNNLKAELKNI